MKRLKRVCAVLAIIVAAAVGAPAQPASAQASIFVNACNHAVSLDLAHLNPHITQSGVWIINDGVPCKKAQSIGQSILFGQVLQFNTSCASVVIGSYIFKQGYGNPVQAISGTNTTTGSCSAAVNSIAWNG